LIATADFATVVQLGCRPDSERGRIYGIDALAVLGGSDAKSERGRDEGGCVATSPMCQTHVPHRPVLRGAECASTRTYSAEVEYYLSRLAIALTSITQHGYRYMSSHHQRAELLVQVDALLAQMDEVREGAGPPGSATAYEGEAARSTGLHGVKHSGFHGRDSCQPSTPDSRGWHQPIRR
jgi:hypothetical protein